MAAGARAQPPPKRTFDIGDGHAITEAGDDSWQLAGQKLDLHNSFWGWEDDGCSPCHVVAYAGAYVFPSGKRSRHTYVIECEGNHYPAAHTTVADALGDKVLKRRLRKAAPPALLN